MADFHIWDAGKRVTSGGTLTDAMLIPFALDPDGSPSLKGAAWSLFKANALASPTITGHPAIEGVTATGATGSGLLVFGTTPTLVGPNITGPLTLTPPSDLVSATFRAFSSGTSHIQQNQTSGNVLLSGFAHAGSVFFADGVGGVADTFISRNGASGAVGIGTTAGGTNGALAVGTVNGLTITSSTGTLTVPNGITLNAGAGGTLGSGAFAPMGATLALDNLASVSINTDLIFNGDGTTSRRIRVADQTAPDTFGNDLLLNSGSGKGTGFGGQIALESGASESGNGGLLSFSGGDGATDSGNGIGGNFFMTGGQGGGNGAGGDFVIQGGEGGSDGLGGAVLIEAGGGGANDKTGGDLIIRSGLAGGVGTHGNLVVGRTLAKIALDENDGSVAITGMVSANGVPMNTRVASANIRNSHDTEASHTGDTVYTLVRTITLSDGLFGSARFLFDLKTSNVLNTGNGRIYHNGAALGTEQSDVTGVYDTKSEDITQDWNPGDTVELWVKIDDAAQTVSVQNFRIAYDDNVAVPSVNS